MEKERKEIKKFIAIGFFIAVVGVVLSATYRQYVYATNINDCHFADTIGSLICVPAASFLFRGISTKFSFTHLIINTTIGFLLCEFLGLLNIHGVFDFYDIIAIHIGAAVTYIISFVFKIDR